MNYLVRALSDRFKKAEFIQFMTTISDVFNSIDVTALSLGENVKKLQESVAAMRMAYLDTEEITLNAELKPLDQKRIKKLRSLKKFILAEIDRDEADTIDQATMLNNSFTQICKGLERFTLQHKTVQIQKLLNAWTTNPKLSEAVQAIGAQPRVNEIMQSNEVFYTNYFSKAKSNIQDFDTSEVKGNIKTIYNNLVTDINALAWINKDNNKYTTLIQELNSVIESNNQPVIYRRGKKRKEAVVTSTLPVPYVSG